MCTIHNSRFVSICQVSAHGIGNHIILRFPSSFLGLISRLFYSYVTDSIMYRVCTRYGLASLDVCINSYAFYVFAGKFSQLIDNMVPFIGNQVYEMRSHLSRCGIIQLKV